MNPLPDARAVEVRQDEEGQRLAQASVSTLFYMMDYGLAKEQALGRQRIDLGYFVEDECGLLEAMRLSERLNRVETNIRRTGRRNERIRAEIVGRQSGR